MEKATEVLVIILSAVLVIFLTIAIVALVKVIQVLKSLKRITEKAEKIADSAEAIGTFFEKTARPMALIELVHNITKSVFKHGNNNKRGQ